MRIARVRIKNFRCLEDVEVRFDDVTSLIGPNGVGKSTVLRALDWFFNGGKASELVDDDRTCGADGKVSVEVEFDRLTAADREALGKHVTVDSDRCVIWKVRDVDGSEMMSGNARTYPGFDDVRKAANATDMRLLYQDLRAADPELGLPAWTSKAAAEQALKTWELENPHRLKDSAVTVTNLFGFAGQSVMSGLFDYVFVSADMRASEESRDGRTALIGRILERTVDRSAADEDIRELTLSVEEQQEEIFDRNFKEQLQNLSNELSTSVGQFTVGRTVVVQPVKQEIKPPRTQFTLSIMDSGVGTPVDKQGHGFQRTLLVSALQLLAKRGTAGTREGAMCLAIEEPELFQHPVQARAFASVLRTLAENPKQNIQVAYATHSPHFVDVSNFDQVRRLTREVHPEHGRAPRVSVCSTTIEDVEKRLADYRQGVRAQLEALAATRLSEAFFSDAAVLVEGTSDKAVLEGLAERSTVTSLLSRGITVVDTKGKPAIMLAHAILTELGIPCYAMFDGDRGSGERMRDRGRTEQAVTDQKFQDAVDNRKILAYLGADEEDFPETGVYTRYAVLEDTLEPLLEQQWRGWTDQLNEIVEAGLATRHKKNALLYLLAARRMTSPPPEFLEDVLRRLHRLVG